MRKEFPKPKPKAKKPNWNIDNIVKLVQKISTVHDDEVNKDMASCSNTLIRDLDRKVGAEYLIKIISESKFSTYRLALGDFTRVVTNYLAGDYSKEDLKIYQENLEPINGDYSHTHFTAARFKTISYILDGSVDDFVEAVGYVFGFDGLSEHDETQIVKYAKVFIIDLAELSYGKKATPLKILMGDKNV